MKLPQIRAAQLLAAGFALIIVLGALLLSLPAASRDHIGIPALNALFTSASATCVTGLVLYDTWTQFSMFGQAVILLLIQIGGLGFMTVVILFPLFIGKRIGLRERDLLAESVGAAQIGGVIRLVRRMLLLTFLFELLGAGILCLRFIPLLGFADGLWTSVFHAVSAFCNAGFDLTGRFAPSSSLLFFGEDSLVLLTIASLIVAGGIGFIVWNDLIERRFHPRALTLHSRAALLATASLLLCGTIFFLLSERDGQLAGMDMHKRLLAAFFQSVTPRTAGFNSLRMDALSETGKLGTILLMFVGAAPGGTGGGVKVTTLAVAAAAVSASLGGREDATLGNYRLLPETQRRAFCTVTFYLALAFAGVCTLCMQGVALADALFECFSAIGTVGLSTGVTASLQPVSKLALILLMYAGRVGSLTVFLAIASGTTKKLKNPVGKIIVG
ncbi:MAG: potassium transporter TrkG [Eubacteriales bacterium]|nr:potassium transporter TrkG [Eubacteriales bacterium]